MPSPIFISRPPPGFSFLAVVRGFQLTVVGSWRALKNPNLATHGYYRFAMRAIGMSILIQLALWLPIQALQRFLWFVNWLFIDEELGARSKIDSFIDTLYFIETHILNIGPFLITIMRYTRPELDDLFLMSLKFFDVVYKQQHPESDRQYYRSLVQYKVIGESRKSKHIAKWMTKIFGPLPDGNAGPVPPPRSETPFGVVTAKAKHSAEVPDRNRTSSAFFRKYLRRTGMSIAIYIGSKVPFIGNVVLPAVSFIAFREVVGGVAAILIFGVGFYLPKSWLIIFLSTFWGGRTLLRELLAPYFNRLPFSKTEREQWFHAREGIMFGFGAGFYMLMRIPFIGILVYGFAESSAAYLITKVSDPPPGPSEINTWTAEQTVWTSREIEEKHKQH